MAGAEPARSVDRRDGPARARGGARRAPVSAAGADGAIVHPTAIVARGSVLGPGVRIGAYTVIAEHVKIGSGTWIGPHVVIEEWTTLGRDCRVYAGAVLGGTPQDRHFRGERSYLRIGDRVMVREYVSISRATGEDAASTVGDDTQFLAYSHAGHNCRIGRGVVITNAVQIAGHVVVEDSANIGGMAGIIQFAQIGTLAMVGGFTRIDKDVPPYMLVNGNPYRTIAINKIGLERAGVPEETQTHLRRAHRLLVRAGLDLSHAIDKIATDCPAVPEIRHLVEFLRASQERGIGIRR
ncbi:MAG TPA: acyl-ACP--UDP-N-acetylglucosamine O-acyltransferase [bacterium]|nr:acyl-ACP--UDP-N-acetylglucosamine O-acyltransferase [bacterium]